MNRNRLKKTVLSIITFILFAAVITGCGNTEATKTTKEETENGKGKTEMVLYIDGKKADVIWEENESVEELKKLAAEEEIIISMTRYSDNEQVGEIGQTITSDDRKTTTHCGDIVLYSSDSLVIFYGSNTWAYTRLGKITNPDNEELTEILKSGDVTVTISAE